jgi:tripartite-type tricarboxylate transporter receptor subunit TctC
VKPTTLPHRTALAALAAWRRRRSCARTARTRTGPRGRWIGADIARVVRSREAGARMARLGLEPVGSTPEQYTASIRQEIDKWAGVIKTAGIKIE